MVTDSNDMALSQAQDESRDTAQQSWGEKYHAGMFSFLRNWFVNYFVNFLIGASTTYAFDTSLLGARFRGWSDAKAEQFKHIAPKQVSLFVIKFLTRTQLLLCGGHIILPLVKWMHDNQRRLEFRIGHRLDMLQEFLGRGNAASKRCIEEYNRVSSLVSIGHHNRKERDPAATELSDHDKQLLAKYSLNEQLQFKEHRQSWWKVIKARICGMAVTTSLSIVMALTSSLPKELPKPWKYARFEDSLEEPWGKILGDKIISRIPIVSWLFRNPAVMTDTLKEGKTALTGHQLIGKYFIDDMIFTGGSKFGFDKMESHHRRKEAAEEAKVEAAAKEAQLAAKRAEIAVGKIEKLEQKKEARERKHILAAGPHKGFMSKEALRDESRSEGLQAV